MKLSDYKGEEALDVLADIIDPISVIFSDADIQKLREKKAPTLAYAKPMLKNHKKEVIEVLARLDNTPVEEYKDTITLLTIPAKLLELLNDPEIQSLFPSEHQKEVTPLPGSGVVTENTGANEN